MVMPELIAKEVDIREQIAHRTHQWLRGLNVDPVALREERGMKGKKHFVELLIGYRDLFNFYQSIGNQTAQQDVMVDAVRALTVIHDNSYHDLNRCTNEQFTQDSLSYLFACDLARFFGQDIGRYLLEITSILPRIYSHIATRGACQRMALVRRLKSLGLPAMESIAQLVDGTVIRRRKNIDKMQKVDVYLIVHEVFHVTDSGRHAAALLSGDDLEYLEALFRELIELLKTADGMDLLAEVIEAMKCLNMLHFPGWQSAVEYVRQHQNADGSFGSYEENRKNVAISGSRYDVDIGMYLHTSVMCLRAAILM